MKKMLQKIFSILLAACFVLSVVPAPAAAAGNDVTNGSYDAAGNWSAGGDGYVTHNIDGTDVTLSKTATPVEGMENTFDITLQVQTKTSTSVHTASGAVVLVFDVSGSMNYCSECGNESRHRSSCRLNEPTEWFGMTLNSSVEATQTRIAAARTAAAAFLKEYAGTDASANRQLSIVEFATNYSVRMDWANVAGGPGNNSYDAVYRSITGISANGGTNLEGGLYTALDQLNDVSGVDSTSVVVLTDGVPTYCIGGGDGSNGSPENNAAAAAQATAIKNKGAKLYTVCFGVANETTYRGGPTVGKFLRDSVASSNCAYDADNAAELNEAFQAISQSITDGLDGAGWTATDPMPGMIDVVSGIGDNFTGSDGNYTWTLGEPEKVVDGNTTTYVYKYTYRVELDVQDPEYVEGTFVPTNEPTYLNTEHGQFEFPVPGVKGYWDRTDITVTKKWEDADNQDGIRPASIMVRLTENGVAKGEAVELNADNNWTYTWDGETYDLIKQSKGAYRNYSVEEVNVPEGYTYTATNTANGEETITLTNYHTPAVVSKTVTKVWNDKDDQDGKRPDSISVVLKADGEDKATVELNEANGWSYTWENLPEKAAGQVINYTVEEPDVPADYEPTVEGLKITNSYTPETIEVSGTKTWDDDNDRDRKRPESITINLLADDVKVGSKTVTAEDGWKYEFTNLPKYRDHGTEIVYSISEEEVDGYVATVNGFNVTNTHNIETVSVSGAKTWNDAENQDGKRPASITINLLADGEKVASKTVTEADGWKWSFTNLPKNDAGVAIVYTIEEGAIGVKGYSSSVEGYNVTNTYTPETITISGTKTWDDADDQDGIRPEFIKVYLFADDVQVGSATVTPDEDGNWTYSFENQPKYRDGGVEIKYEVTEEPVDDYVTNVNGFNITNTHTPDVTDITVTKVWEDEYNLEGFRPDSVTVILLAGGKEVGTIDLSEDNNWTHTFENLPANAAGEDIAYTVKEMEVENYEVTISGSEEEGYTITNSRDVEYVEIEVKKVWDDDSNRDGIRPESVSVNVFANGFGAENNIVELSDENGWTHKYSMPKYAGGKEVKYTVAEEKVPEGYTASEPSGNMEKGFTITNTHIPATTSVNVNKVWDDADNQDGMRAKSVTVNLLADGTKVDSVELNERNEWKHTFDKLYVNSNGKSIEYTVEEEKVSNYKATISGTLAEGFTITNFHAPIKIEEISVTKVWDDANNQDGKRPASITINLLADKEKVDEIVLSDENGWSGSFTELPMYKDGKEIKYSVEEVKVDGYKSKITGSVEEGFTVTNTHEVEKIDEIKVTKVWDDADDQDGIRPEKITVNLLANGEMVASAELKATLRTIFTGDWTATFKDMPKYANGEEIVYTITENAVSGYETKIAGSVENGFTVTNTHEPEMTKLDVQKFWDDENDKHDTRADSVKITLYANGKSTGKTVTLNEKNQWFDSFENLPKYDNGKEIKYTVKEASLALYKASYSYNGTKAVVTNTLSEVPNTGDTSNVGLYLGLMGVCAVAAVALILLNKKKRNA